MTAFTVWKFETLDGAEKAAKTLRSAQQDKLVVIDDLAVLEWPVGAKEPKISHHGPGKKGAAIGGVGGLVLGAAFLIPLVGLATGAAVGAMANKYRSVGITDEQIEEIRAQVTEGSSALFLITQGANLDRLGERFLGTKMKLIETNLTEAERANLYETFGGK
jgi:uncharacterized membrane protein